MTERFTNPIMERGADPFVVFWKGKYYYVFSTEGKVYVSSADNIHHLTRDGKCVWVPEEGKEYSKSPWAPEIHEIDGEWYLHVACDDGAAENHRMFVLRSKDSTPDGEYEMVGKIADGTDCFAIDGTVLKYNGELYYVWSGWDENMSVWVPHSQNIYIAKMSSPTQIVGERVLLSRPEYDWEKQGSGPAPNGRIRPTINEGPQILYKDDTIHIVFSASHSMWRHYCLGLLTFRGGDIMNPESWTKCPHPVFSENEGTHGPGHCSFVKAVDGETDFIIYHAMLGTEGGWHTRGFRAQPFTWDGDVPVFGEAAKPGDEIEIPV